MDSIQAANHQMPRSTMRGGIPNEQQGFNHLNEQTYNQETFEDLFSEREFRTEE